MKYIYKLSATLAILSGVTFFGGCTKDSTLEKATVSEAEVNFKPAVRSAERTKAVSGNVTETGVFTSEEGIAIPFTRTVENTASFCATKGALANTSGETMALNEAGINSFRICAVNGDGTVYIPCMKNVRYLDGKWQAERTYTWKGAEDKKFFAVANFGENISMTPDEDGSVNIKTALVIPDKAEEQKDFIFAQTVADGDSDNDGVIDGTVSLQFDHICTSVIFKCGTMTGVERIKSISIEGVTGCREYDVTFNADGSLNGESTETDIYTKTVYAIVDGELPAVGEAIDEPFILIPQNLESQPVTLRILATINGHDYELISEVHSGIWEAGKTNVYTLGFSTPAVDIDPICFRASGEQSVRFVKYNVDDETESAANANLSYSYDGELWYSWKNTSSALSFGTADKPALYIIGNNPEGFSDNDIALVDGAPKMSNYDMFAFGNKSTAVTVSGNIITLVNDKENLSSFPVSVTKPFVGLFRGAPISDASGLKLDSDWLMPFAYYGMFMQNSKLKKTPSLGCNTLAPYCYGQMFFACTSLQTAPELPATELAPYCYTQMFISDILMNAAPELPAESLAEGCYKEMFLSCMSLTHIKMLATDISATFCLDGWTDNVAATGTFVKAAAMTSLPSGTSGIPTGWTVENAGE